MKAVGYARVSTSEQSQGHSLDAQHAAITEACTARGWKLVGVETDVASGKATDKRPGLQRALAAVRSGQADILVAHRLDRLTRSLAFLAALLEECGRPRIIARGKRLPPWRLVILANGDVDMTTAQGELLANVLGAVARMERRLISDRTREGLAHARLHGTKRGTPIGRPAVLPDKDRARIVSLRHEGLSWPAIARKLNDAKIKTAHGGAKWYPSTARAAFLYATRKPLGSK
jgi:DNA invertase Pin-like site-specific DNA recombinase